MLKAVLLTLQVMDLSVMTHVSDIPDWCYIEAYGVEVGPCTLSLLCQILPRFRPGPCDGFAAVRRVTNAWRCGRRQRTWRTSAACLR